MEESRSSSRASQTQCFAAIVATAPRELVARVKLWVPLTIAISSVSVPVNDPVHFPVLTFPLLQTASYYSCNFELKDPDSLVARYIIKDTISGLPKEKSFCGHCGCTLFTIPTKVFTTSASDGPKEVVIRVALIQNG